MASCEGAGGTFEVFFATWQQAMSHFSHRCKWDAWRNGSENIVYHICTGREPLLIIVLIGTEKASARKDSVMFRQPVHSLISKPYVTLHYPATERGGVCFWSHEHTPRTQMHVLRKPSVPHTLLCPAVNSAHVLQHSPSLGLSSFQESVAMDRIQRILGVLQNPYLGYVSSIYI